MNLDKEMFKKDFTKKLMTMFAENIEDASELHKYLALGTLIKEYSAEDLMKTNSIYSKDKRKQVYYFSLEFLIGRLLCNNLINLGIKTICEEGLRELDIDLNDLEECEVDAGLGNGGLGRLAACFLDSMASLEIPGHGSGIRYKFGLFEQKIVNGYQVELPDNWLRYGDIWETKRENKAVTVKFGGKVQTAFENNKLKFYTENYDSVIAVPYDIPIIGYENNTVNTLRLWSAETPESDFDFFKFSKGEYLEAIEKKAFVESICQVLYPDDSNLEGKLLRLKQQYFFVSAGIQSIIRSFKKLNLPMREFDKYIAIHINDTHPTVAIPELIRILIDEENLSWDDAWKITVNTIAYTNHTILNEALEKWPVDMFKKLLPRIYMIVEEIDKRFRREISSKYPNDIYKINEMSIISDGVIRMAYLAIVGCHSVNGVAKLHTEILKYQELSNFYTLYPEKFNNKTNGITHRRWLIYANPKLSEVITETIGADWKANPNELIELIKYKDDKVLCEKIFKVKQNNKIQFSNLLKQNYNIDVDPNSIFDVHAKRLHAYKRQLLNIMNIMDLYNKLLQNPDMDIFPRTFFFAAKASPSYHLAKQTIKLINSIADKINNDKTIKGKIKVVFLENYRVSLAEKIIPCADISEQISTASKEASGTGNMKFMMNGAITIATLDGANIEIKEQVGEENMILFGLTAQEVISYYKNRSYNAYEIYTNDRRVNKIINQFVNGFLNVAPSEFQMIQDSLLAFNDDFFVLKDFSSYIDAQNRADKLYRNKNKWQEMSLINIAHSGVFSSDNTIKMYAKDIWRI